MIHTEEDDEFERILREQKIKYPTTDAVKAAVLAELEALAAEAEKNGNTILAMQIRARGNT
jgi:hypothetical protein